MKIAPTQKPTKAKPDTHPTKKSREPNLVEWFTEDCVDALRNAKFRVRLNRKLGRNGRSVDILVSKGANRCVVALKKSGRREFLESTLGNEVLKARETSSAVVVCVPYILDRSLVEVFEAIGLSLCSVGDLVETVYGALKPRRR